jgi:ATP-binding protein involved in chromosome partitioning
MNKVEVPVIGVIENMSYFVPDELPGNKYYIFGKNGGSELAAKYKIPLLGQLPLVMGIADNSDKGIPAFFFEKNHILKKEFESIAQKIAQNISVLNIKKND